MFLCHLLIDELHLQIPPHDISSALNSTCFCLVFSCCGLEKLRCQSFVTIITWLCAIIGSLLVVSAHTMHRYNSGWPICQLNIGWYMAEIFTNSRLIVGVSVKCWLGSSQHSANRGILADVIVYIFAHLHRALPTEGKVLHTNWLQAAKELVEFNTWWKF